MVHTIWKENCWETEDKMVKWEQAKWLGRRRRSCKDEKTLKKFISKFITNHDTITVTEFIT